MIEIPWQIIASLVGLLGLFILTSHWHKRDTDDRIQSARLDERRDQRAQRAVEIEIIRSLTQQEIDKIRENCKCNGPTE